MIMHEQGPKINLITWSADSGGNYQMLGGQEKLDLNFYQIKIGPGRGNSLSSWQQQILVNLDVSEQLETCKLYSDCFISDVLIK